MSQITHLWGIFSDDYMWGAIPTSKATATHVINRITMLKTSILRKEQALKQKTPGHHPSTLQRMINCDELEIEELYEFYVGKLKQERRKYPAITST